MPHHEIIQTVFTDEQTQAAQCLMQEIISLRQDGQDLQEWQLLRTPECQQCLHALPAQFYFFFPPDAYENTSEHIKDGLDSQMIQDSMQGGSLCVMFVEKAMDFHDWKLADWLQKGILPDWIKPMDEDCWSSALCPHDMTVKDFIQMLCSLGFEYRPDSHYGECLLKSHSQELNFTPVEYAHGNPNILPYLYHETRHQPDLHGVIQYRIDEELETLNAATEIFIRDKPELRKKFEMHELNKDLHRNLPVAPRISRAKI